MNELTHMEPGMPILYGGNKLARVPDEIAERFRPGDRLLVVQRTGEILHVPQAQWEIAASAVRRALEAFHALGAAGDDRITAFYEAFASRLEDKERSEE